MRPSNGKTFVNIKLLGNGRTIPSPHMHVWCIFRQPSGAQAAAEVASAILRVRPPSRHLVTLSPPDKKNGIPKCLLLRKPRCPTPGSVACMGRNREARINLTSHSDDGVHMYSRTTCIGITTQSCPQAPLRLSR